MFGTTPLLSLWVALAPTSGGHYWNSILHTAARNFYFFMKTAPAHTAIKHNIPEFTIFQNTPAGEARAQFLRNPL